MITVYIPKVCVIEQRYILDIVFTEFLGIEFTIFEHDERDIKITKVHSTYWLSLNADFFHRANQKWLLPESMPNFPLASWTPSNEGIDVTLVDRNVPVLYGQAIIRRQSNNCHLGLDIFGSAFFMLSRYEEGIVKDRDAHGRFPAWASMAYKAGFLNRPLINEYLEILWAIMKEQWPDLIRKKRSFRKFISCDVDHPFDLVGHSLKKTLVRVGARLIRDKNPKLALIDASNYFYKKLGSDRFDEYRNNIDWIMKVNGAKGNVVAFYFIPIQTDCMKEEANDVRNSKLTDLVAHIINSGHEVGIHPGYGTYNNPIHFKESVVALKSAFTSRGVAFKNIGGRQHYLRFDITKTPQIWNDNRLAYDSSLGYADMAGFRSGVCYEYTMYNLADRNIMSLKQRPLIVMECTIISNSYEGLGYSNKALARFDYFKNICEIFQGDFSLLWHNSYFHSPAAKIFYERLV